MIYEISFPKRRVLLCDSRSLDEEEVLWLFDNFSLDTHRTLKYTGRSIHLLSPLLLRLLSSVDR